MYDFRKDFPIFGHSSLIYLDSAATTQKPQCVIDRVSEYLSRENANIHRWWYSLSDHWAELYANSKKTYESYIRAGDQTHTVYSANATHAINEITLMIEASGSVRSGDHLLIQRDNHHANIVPWMILAQKVGATIDWLDLRSSEDIHTTLTQAITPMTRIVALTHASNVSGAYYDWRWLKKILPSACLSIIDASQSLAHGLIDMSAIGADFVVTTGHKCYALTGIGAYSAPKDLLRSLTPGIGGWWAINFVRSDGFAFAGLPSRHEPGTPHVVGAVSLMRAIEYLTSHESDHLAHEAACVAYFCDLYETRLSAHFDLIRPVTPERIGVFSLLPKQWHIRDYSDHLDARGIAVRSGQHCCEPLYESLGKNGSLRISLGVYTTKTDLDTVTEVLLDARSYV